MTSTLKNISSRMKGNSWVERRCVQKDILRSSWYTSIAVILLVFQVREITYLGLLTYVNFAVQRRVLKDMHCDEDTHNPYV